jgi:hypothetical protein
MKDNITEADLFQDGVRIFLDYIYRQQKKNQDYKAHPIIRAFICALEGMKEAKEGERTMGYSREGTAESVYEPYVVVLEKKGDGIEVKEIKNLSVDKEIPVDVMLTIFRLQISLDKIVGDTVSPQQFVDALNHVIPGNKFYALGDRWKEARDLFAKRVKEGKFRIPEQFRHSGLIEELTSIRYDTQWEDYSNRARSTIGSSIMEVLDNKDVQVIITSPTNSIIEKYKVFDAAIQFMLGKAADYLNPLNDK